MRLSRLCAAILAAASLGSLASAGIPVWPGAKDIGPSPAKRGVHIDAPAGPVADGDAVKVKPYTLVRLKAGGADPKAALIWRVTPAAGVDKATTPRGTLEFTAPPGTYAVELLAISTGPDGALAVDEKTVPVVIEAPGAPPPVVPPPPKDGGSGKLDPPKALGKISFPPFGCTATVIGPRRTDGKWDVLTAAHCTSHVKIGAVGSMRMLDGRTFAVRVAAVDAQADCCWMVTQESPDDMPYANLAADIPAVGTAIWHAGYGVDKPGNREDGSVTGGEDGNGQIKMRISVSSGDSGGGFFRTDTSEVISTVCCTREKGAKADVWGASVKRIRALRPGAAAAGDGKPCEHPKLFEWTPIDIPTVTGP